MIAWSPCRSSYQAGISTLFSQPSGVWKAHGRIEVGRSMLPGRQCARAAWEAGEFAVATLRRAGGGTRAGRQGRRRTRGWATDGRTAATAEEAERDEGDGDDRGRGGHESHGVVHGGESPNEARADRLRLSFDAIEDRLVDPVRHLVRAVRQPVFEDLFDVTVSCHAERPPIAIARAAFTAASHQGALSAKGRTIAVLGTGINIVFPPENAELFERIAANGAVVSQYRFNRNADKQSFAIRNRIVAGMTLGTVVVEANLSSGALITANFAVEYGRQIFAVPGRIDSPRSKGCHDLIKKGAKLCEGAEDILSEFEYLFPRAISRLPLLRPACCRR